jgi:anti-sigma B factor antagonist
VAIDRASFDPAPSRSACQESPTLDWPGVVESSRQTRHEARALRARANAARSVARSVRASGARTELVGTANGDGFHVTVMVGNDEARLELDGELDLGAVPRLLERFEQVWDNNGQHRSLILIDVTALTYCDSSGIHALVGAAARCEQNGRKFRVVGAQGTVRRVFELTSVVDILNADGVE